MGQVNLPLGADKATRMALQKLSAKLTGNLTANRLLYYDDGNILSVDPLTNWIAGTTNQITSTDDGDGTITLSLPQDYHTAATPTLAQLTLTRSDSQPKLLVRAPTDTGNGSQAQIELNAGVSSTTRWLIWASSAQDNLVFYDAIDARNALVIDTNGITTLTGLDLSGITDGNIPYISAAGFADSPLSVVSGSVTLTQNSDTINFSHDGTDAYFKTTDGSFIFQTDEGTNSNTVFELKGKGTGAGYLQVMDEDDAEWIQMNCLAGVGYIGTTGSAPAGIKIMNSAYGDVELFGGSTSGITREFKVYGYRTGDALRSLEIGTGVDAADSASYDGVSTHFFNENIVVGSSFPSTVSQRFEITDTDRSDMVIHTVNDTVGKTASLSFGVTTGYGSVIQNGSRSVDLVATRNASNVFSLGFYASDGTTNNLVLTLNGNKQATFEGDILFSSGAGLLFGEIYGYDKATEIVVSGAGIANKVQITCFDTNGQSNGTTPDHTNDHITVLTSGIYKITVSLSCKSTAAGDADNIGFAVYKNNGATLLHQTKRQLAGGGVDIGAVPISGLASLTANDTIEVWLWNIDDTDNVVIDDINLSIVMIGG